MIMFKEGLNRKVGLYAFCWFNLEFLVHVWTVELWICLRSNWERLNNTVWMSDYELQAPETIRYEHSQEECRTPLDQEFGCKCLEIISLVPNNEMTRPYHSLLKHYSLSNLHSPINILWSQNNRFVRDTIECKHPIFVYIFIHGRGFRSFDRVARHSGKPPLSGQRGPAATIPQLFHARDTIRLEQLTLNQSAPNRCARIHVELDCVRVYV